MCGIYGYAGRNDNAPQVLFEGLKQLEYRGYDSSGISFFDGERMLKTIKACGAVKRLLPLVENRVGDCGIAHTRWATHGKPCKTNAHPIAAGDFVIVHNGIIENFEEIKKECVLQGEKFKTETDTEVISVLLKLNFKGDIIEAIKNTIQKLKGSFALLIMHKKKKGQIYGAVLNMPLVALKTDDAVFFSSDASALSDKGNKFLFLENDEICIANKNEIKFLNNGHEVSKKEKELCFKCGNFGGCTSCVMEKEIYEIPAALKNTYLSFCKNNQVNEFREALKRAKNVFFTACGTAFHAALFAKYILPQKYAKNGVFELASELRYKESEIKYGDLVVAISQSGETADTIAACELLKEKGAKIAVITNNEFSRLANMADFLFCLDAGSERAVAATKSFCCQLLILILLLDGEIIKEDINALIADAKQALKIHKLVKNLVKENAKIRKYFFIGRQEDSILAMESALKVKEITYIHSEGYAAGELKHGTISLIDKNSLTTAFICREHIAEKTLNAVHEVKARNGNVLIITSLEKFDNGFDGNQVAGARTIKESVFARSEVTKQSNKNHALTGTPLEKRGITYGLPRRNNIASRNDDGGGLPRRNKVASRNDGEKEDQVIYIKCQNQKFAQIVAIIPTQIFALEIAKSRNLNPDMPRNLAKSVTVE